VRERKIHSATSPSLLNQEFWYEQNSFSRAGGFSGNGRFRAGNDALCEFVPSANSFKYNASYSSGC